jgi:hypothetical protein
MSFIWILSAYVLVFGDDFSGIVVVVRDARTQAFFPAKSADAPPVPIFRWPVDDLNSIFVIRVQLRVLCPKSRAVRVLFSCPQTRAGNFCPVFANEMNFHYLVYLSFVGAAFRVH